MRPESLVKRFQRAPRSRLGKHLVSRHTWAPRTGDKTTSKWYQDIFSRYPLPEPARRDEYSDNAPTWQTSAETMTERVNIPCIFPQRAVLSHQTCLHTPNMPPHCTH